VAGPIIPYIPGHELEIAIPLIGELIDFSRPPSIKPFGTLVALGVYIGSIVTMNRARERKLDTQQMSDFIFWVVATGFVLSHVLDAIFYQPQKVMADPLYLLRIWEGLSSYGGFIGALVGALAWRFYRKKRIIEYVDVMASAFPLAWIFGRMGCSVVHDHPGALSNAWFAVKYPPQMLAEGFDGRYDLGLYEMLLTIPLACACHVLWKKQPLRSNGFYLGITLTAYAPVRFLLDFLRVQPEVQVFRGATDLRYAGLTPAQWACFLALGVGIYFLKNHYAAAYVLQADLEPEDEPPDGAEDEHEPESAGSE
jgi:phosphatidylglycerol:prolipoprotein diacylglycerol transferase